MDQPSQKINSQNSPTVIAVAENSVSYESTHLEATSFRKIEIDYQLQLTFKNSLSIAQISWDLFTQFLKFFQIVPPIVGG